ncbi:cytochrome P450 77A2 [Cocos nucifera]|uniref:Cytochrome P450 77A2 n=1 Tax=Cocos nucifera TaxID=13894 RepID=A0A8K0NCH8_COCNU|nr:cytochrome P450 77A2 [Cocos nucifera]
MVMASLLTSSSASPSPSHLKLLFTALAFVLSLLALLVFNKNKNRKKKKAALNLPPGPPGWPIVGNLFQVALSGKLFIHLARDLFKEYGPIFTLRMGARTLIVIGTAELAHEALIEKGQLFASRPAENPTRIIFSCDKFTVNSAVYGPEWRSLRRNMVSGMLSAARLREFRPVRSTAMDRFIDRLRAEAEASGGAVWVLSNARFAVFCILLAMTFGLQLDEDDIVRIDAVMKKVLMTLNPRIDDYFPFLGFLYYKQRRRALQVRKEQIDTILPLIEKRKAILKDPTIDPCAAPFSYLDSLLDLKVEGRSAAAPSDEELVTLCSEFINGGTDTTATAIEWAIARLIEDPSRQARIHDEILAECGDRPVDERDTEKMVYLQAFVKELLRKHPPTYFSLTHAAIQPACKLGEYDIPANANLEIFLPTISEDPRFWSNPTEFNPDRFLTGGETADMTGVTGIRMIPFGAGRRICPGLGMGTTHITLMVARAVQAFVWRAHPSQTTLDFGDNVEFTVVMRRHLLAMVKPRK